MGAGNGQAKCRFRRRLADMVRQLEEAGGVGASYDRKCEADFEILAIEEELAHISEAEAGPIHMEIEQIDAAYHLGGWQVDRLKLVHRMPVAVQASMEAGLLHGDWSPLRKLLRETPGLATGLVRVVSHTDAMVPEDCPESADAIMLLLAEIRSHVESVDVTEGS